MVAGAREGTPGDAVLGVVPRLVVEPSTVAEAAEALAACARDRLRVVFAGGGTDLELGAPPSGLDVVLRTTRLTRVVEHAPADQIAVVEAGITLSTLATHLAAHGQRLALDPPLPGRATLGGVVAANAFGPRRHRFGTSRDLVVGMTFVRADGVLAKGGGKVVKNVAGFDVPRLLVGSLGTLALVATVTVRLHPLPEAQSTVLVPGLRAADVRAVTAALLAAQLEPTSVAALLEGEDLRLGVRFEGFGPGVAEQRDRFVALAADLRLAPEPLAPEEARAFWSRHDAIRSGGALRTKVAAPPSSIAEVTARALRPVLGAVGQGAAVLYPTLGLALTAGPVADPGASSAAIGAAREALAALGGHLVVTAAPPAVRATTDVWGPPPPSLELMRRVKRELDPDHRLAPGRFLGGT
jgi:glycolate oxidase FAD binding subunit